MSVDLEICEIADRVMKRPGGGPALLFENVTLFDGSRSEYPVAINLFGSMRRMSMSLGVERLDEIGDRITQMLDLKVPQGLVAKLSLLPRLLELGKFPPRVKGGAPPCQEVVLRGDEIDLRKLPIIKCWPEDGGPYVTLPMVISRDPKRGIRNVGMYRVQLLVALDLACTGSATRSARAHWRDMAERKETMPGLHRDWQPIALHVLGVARRATPRSMSSCSRASCGARRCGWRKAVTCDLEVPGIRVRHRGVHRPLGAARHRGSVRRPHGLLLPRRSVSARARDGVDDALAPGVRDDHRWTAADGRLLPWARDGANLPSPAEADRARDRRLPHAGRRHLPQPRVRLDRQAISWTCLQSDERAVGRGSCRSQRISSSTPRERARSKAVDRSTTSIGARRAVHMVPIDLLPLHRVSPTVEDGHRSYRKWHEEGFAREWAEYHRGLDHHT